MWGAKLDASTSSALSAAQSDSAELHKHPTHSGRRMTYHQQWDGSADALEGCSSLKAVLETQVIYVYPAWRLF